MNDSICTEATIKARVDELRAKVKGERVRRAFGEPSANDREAWHQEEDAIYLDVLRELAKTSPLAAEAVKAHDIDFERLYA